VSWYQKGKTSLDFTEARDSERQRHQLGHMQVCTSLQTDNHASTPPLSFSQAGCPSCRPTNSDKALKSTCETLMSAKQAINDKLQGSVATYLWCGGVVNNQIKKGLLPSLRVKIFFKLVNIWQSYKQECDCLMHFVCLANTLLKDGESA